MISWLCLAIATNALIAATLAYGLFDVRVLADAEMGYFGLFSFGAAAFGVLLAKKGGLHSTEKIFRIFRVTFFVAIAYVVPLILTLAFASFAETF